MSYVICMVQPELKLFLYNCCFELQCENGKEHDSNLLQTCLRKNLAMQIYALTRNIKII